MTGKYVLLDLWAKPLLEVCGNSNGQGGKANYKRLASANL